MPKTKLLHPSYWRMLILNEHLSYDTDAFILTAFRNKVFYLYLPPYTSYKT